PNSGSFNITGQTSSNQSMDIEVLNTIGQSVYHTTWAPVNNKINENLQLSNLPSGIYTLRAKSGEGISTVRFTISK
ncbi:MAG: T9SS type A sorting domain-containing protein, partial [Flavipsychrobacter sp.]